MKLPESTRYEKILGERLARMNIPYKSGPMIWFTRTDYYTPDLVIGKRLIVEVDGSIHDVEARKAPDRIRHRALENLGYYVYRVRNEQIDKDVGAVVEEIIQRYYETTDLGKSQPKIEIVRPDGFDFIPKFIQNNIKEWSVSFNRLLEEESWTADYFKQHLPEFDLTLVTNQSALERFMLLLLGLNLRMNDEGILDFGYSAKLFGRSIMIVQEMFGEQGQMAGIHLKNMFNVSAPGFLKNLVFFGGPRINQGIISITNLQVLKTHIDAFNLHFSRYGVTVEEAEVKAECMHALKKVIEPNSSFQWIIDWIA
jgi:very-short-patch-repair endonuclease